MMLKLNFCFLLQLIEDFNSIYPVKKDGLFEYFPLFKEKILNFGKNISKTLKDSTLKCIINEYLDLAEGNYNFYFFNT